MISNPIQYVLEARKKGGWCHKATFWEGEMSRFGLPFDDQVVIQEAESFLNHWRHDGWIQVRIVIDYPYKILYTSPFNDDRAGVTAPLFEPFSNISLQDMKLYLSFMKIAKELRVSKCTIDFCRRAKIDYPTYMLLQKDGLNMNDIYRVQAQRVVSLYPRYEKSNDPFRYNKKNILK